MGKCVSVRAQYNYFFFIKKSTQDNPKLNKRVRGRLDG